MESLGSSSEASSPQSPRAVRGVTVDEYFSTHSLDRTQRQHLSAHTLTDLFHSVVPPNDSPGFFAGWMGGQEEDPVAEGARLVSQRNVEVVSRLAAAALGLPDPRPESLLTDAEAGGHSLCELNEPELEVLKAILKNGRALRELAKSKSVRSDTPQDRLLDRIARLIVVHRMDEPASLGALRQSMQVVDEGGDPFEREVLNVIRIAALDLSQLDGLVEAYTVRTELFTRFEASFGPVAAQVLKDTLASRRPEAYHDAEKLREISARGDEQLLRWCTFEMLHVTARVLTCTGWSPLPNVDHRPVSRAEFEMFHAMAHEVDTGEARPAARQLLSIFLSRFKWDADEAMDQDQCTRVLDIFKAGLAEVREAVREAVRKGKAVDVPAVAHACLTVDERGLPLMTVDEQGRPQNRVAKEMRKYDRKNAQMRRELLEGLPEARQAILGGIVRLYPLGLAIYDLGSSHEEADDSWEAPGDTETDNRVVHCWRMILQAAFPIVAVEDLGKTGIKELKNRLSAVWGVDPAAIDETLARTKGMDKAIVAGHLNRLIADLIVRGQGLDGASLADLLNRLVIAHEDFDAIAAAAEKDPKKFGRMLLAQRLCREIENSGIEVSEGTFDSVRTLIVDSHRVENQIFGNLSRLIIEIARTRVLEGVPPEERIRNVGRLLALGGSLAQRGYTNYQNRSPSNGIVPACLSIVRALRDEGELDKKQVSGAIAARVLNTQEMRNAVPELEANRQRWTDALMYHVSKVAAPPPYAEKPEMFRRRCVGVFRSAVGCHLTAAPSKYELDLFLAGLELMRDSNPVDVESLGRAWAVYLASTEADSPAMRLNRCLLAKQPETLLSNWTDRTKLAECYFDQRCSALMSAQLPADCSPAARSEFLTELSPLMLTELKKFVKSPFHMTPEREAIISCLAQNLVVIYLKPMRGLQDVEESLIGVLNEERPMLRLALVPDATVKAEDLANLDRAFARLLSGADSDLVAERIIAQPLQVLFEQLHPLCQCLVEGPDAQLVLLQRLRALHQVFSPELLGLRRFHEVRTGMLRKAVLYTPYITPVLAEHTMQQILGRVLTAITQTQRLDAAYRPREIISETVSLNIQQLFALIQIARVELHQADQTTIGGFTRVIKTLQGYWLQTTGVQWGAWAFTSIFPSVVAGMVASMASGKFEAETPKALKEFVEVLIVQFLQGVNANKILNLLSVILAECGKPEFEQGERVPVDKVAVTNAMFAVVEELQDTKMATLDKLRLQVLGLLTDRKE